MAHFARTDVREFLANSPGSPRDHATSIVQARRLHSEGYARHEAEVGELARMQDVAIATALPVRLFDCREKRAGPSPVVVYFHGGGFTLGSIDTHASLCAKISRSLDLPVCSVGYRLAPEHPFPAAIEDCLTAARWLAHSPSALAHRVSGLIPAGDSAGATLAAVVARELRSGLPVPLIAQVLFYPLTDFTAEGGSMDENAVGWMFTAEAARAIRGQYFASMSDAHDSRASPQLSDDFEGLPPAFVLACERDPLRDQARSYAARLVQHGVPTRFYEAAGQIHGALTRRKSIPSAQSDLDICLEQIASLIATQVTESSWRRLLEQSSP